MEVLFVHGAGGWADDQQMARVLESRLGVEVSVPRFPEEDMSAAAWRGELEGHLHASGPDLVVVAHSFGASMVLLHFAGHPPGDLPLGLVLLAMPFWGSEGWQAEYSLPPEAQLPAGLPLQLHHCGDDDVVPIDHLDHHAARLPQALTRRYDSGGHQFEGRMGAVADDLAALAR